MESALGKHERRSRLGSVVPCVKPLEVEFPLFVRLTVLATFVPAPHGDTEHSVRCTKEADVRLERPARTG